VLDFGIAKAAAMPSDSKLTGTGVALGTPQYMSPEQMQEAKDVDARSDVWSLGVTAFELLTGELPFRADSMPALCAKILTDPPAPLRALRADAPEALEAVLARCLAKDKGERFDDIAALATALAPFAPDSTARVARVCEIAAAPAPPSVVQPRMPVLAIAVAAAAVVLGGLWLWLPRSEPAALSISTAAGPLAAKRVAPARAAASPAASSARNLQTPSSQLRDKHQPPQASAAPRDEELHGDALTDRK
jgi:serine/threonine-protein kinase